MKALQLERAVARFAAARVASSWRPGSGGRFLRAQEVGPPELPGEGWVRLFPRLAGICGSDLATVDARSSRWFEPIVSFPFVPGHEVVADTEDGRRVVVEPVLGCSARAVVPPCPACARGRSRHCQNLTAGAISPGLQTGFCRDTGGGWSLSMTAHESQLHEVGLGDEGAVLVEPMACAVHAALCAPGNQELAVVVGAGTLGLGTLAALKSYRPDLSTIAVAKHPHQRRWAQDLGARAVVEPGELRRAVRRVTGGRLLDNGQLGGGCSLVFDCVGSAASLADALAVTAPGGTVVLAGMPGPSQVDLTPLWQREIRLVGSYTYGPEPALNGLHSFDLASQMIGDLGLDRFISAKYPLDRAAEAIAHAAEAGRRGAIKVVFDLRGEKRSQMEGK